MGFGLAEVIGVRGTPCAAIPSMLLTKFLPRRLRRLRIVRISDLQSSARRGRRPVIQAELRDRIHTGTDVSDSQLRFRITELSNSAIAARKMNITFPMGVEVSTAILMRYGVN